MIPGGHTLLLIDDEEANLDLLEEFLAPREFGVLVRTRDPREAATLFEAHRPDVVLLDLHMPHRSGFEVLRDLRELIAPDEYLPILVLTADASGAARARALSEGANDFLAKPLDALEVALRVRNLLQTRDLYRMQAAARAAAEAAEQRARLLAEASRALGASLDSATTLRQLTRTLVPALADHCAVEIPGAGPAGRHEALREACGEPAGGPASVLRAPLRGAAGELGTLTLVRHDPLRDFGEEEAELARELGRRAALALENARHFADARRATRARDQVLSFVAHDLRNPLGSISASAEMLRLLLPPDAPSAHLQTLARIEQTAQRMHGMVEDLLEVSRLEQGALTVHPAAVPAGSLFAEAEAMLRPLSRLHDVALSFDGPAAPLVLADAPRVVQVLSNLVGNGFKFTPAGGRVEVRWRAQPGELVVSVEDTGSGIAADELPHVFGSFWQSRPADRRGVGLGLVIARAVVAAHDGRMWVDSHVGIGSTFHFTLPLAAPEETR